LLVGPAVADPHDPALSRAQVGSSASSRAGRSTRRGGRQRLSDDPRHATITG
jgi:hypothetical protein